MQIEHLSKKTIIISSIVFVLIIIAVLIIISFSNVKKTNSVDNSNSNGPPSRAELIQKASTSMQGKKDVLNYAKAMSYKKRFYCTIIQNETLRQNCILNTPEGTDTLEQTQPVNIPQAKDSLNYAKAKSYKDSSYCNLIINTTMKQSCIAEVPPTEPTTQDTQSTTITSTTTTTNPQDAIQNQESSLQTTKDNLNYAKAKSYKDSSYCNQIVNETLKQQCLSETSN